jgi:hypothetical protein
VIFLVGNTSMHQQLREIRLSHMAFLCMIYSKIQGEAGILCFRMISNLVYDLPGRVDNLRGDFVGRMGYVLEFMQALTYLHNVRAEVQFCLF